MAHENYTITIEVECGAVHAFDCINNVPGWFGGKGFEGHSSRPDDEFVFRYGEGDHAHYSRQKLSEFIRGRKVTWLVTESYISWITNHKEEWTGTRMIFELTEKDGKILLHFTHDGLTPELECYTEVKKGWDMIIGDWLFNFINKAAGN